MREWMNVQRWEKRKGGNFKIIKMKIYKPTPLKNLSWSQAKSRFPLMNPLGDADKDGVKNFKDCKPFDIKRQGFVDIHGKEVKEVKCKECGGETRTPIDGYCMGCAFQKGLIK